MAKHAERADASAELLEQVIREIPEIREFLAYYEGLRAVQGQISESLGRSPVQRVRRVDLSKFTVEVNRPLIL